MLSSDILESQVGPTEIEVLYQDHRNRIIRTRVLSSDQTLELSWVSFRQEGAKIFPKVHRSIRDGASMGKAFRDAGIDFIRESRSVTKSKVPAVFNAHFNSSAPATVVEVTISVGPERTPYADILEVYSPAIEWPGPYQVAQENQQKKLEQFAENLTNL